MAFGIPEFPSGSMYDSDLSELLRLYKKLVSEYDDFIVRLSKLEGRLTELEEHIDDVLNEKLKEVYADMEKLRQDMIAIQQELEANVNEALRQIQELQKDVTKRIAELEQYVDQEVADMKGYVDREVSELRRDVATEINNLKIYVGAELDRAKTEMKLYIDREIARFERVLADMQEQLNDFKNYSDIQNEKLRQELEAEIRELEEKIVNITVDQVWVVSPIDGTVMNIQNAINQLWDSVDWWSLTAREYDLLGLTAEEYDTWDTLLHTGYGLAAEEYDFLGKWYLMEKGGLIKALEDMCTRVMEKCEACKSEVNRRLTFFYKELVRRTTMFSPWTGKVDEVKNIVAKMFDFFSYGALRADEYDNLDLTAQEYDDKDITAYDYDWFGIRALTGHSFIGITAEEYDNLGITPDGHVVYI